MSTSVKALIVVLIAATAVSVAAVVFMAAERRGAADQDEEEAVKTASHVSVQNGRTLVTLDVRTQAREGIRVAPVVETAMRTEVHGTAVVLAVADLAATRNNYVAARSRIERDEVSVKLSGAQYERVRTLYEQDQNMSLKAMQDAEAAYRTAEAQLRADRQDVALQLETLRQRWGAVIANWTATDNPALQAVLEQRSCLAQVILPPGQVANAPASLCLALPGNRTVQARFVSSLPQVNTQIQGIGFAYLVPARTGLAVGMTLPVLIPVGELLSGTLVPESAVVWWQGTAWVYQAMSATTFARRQLPASNPTGGGYFVPGSVFPAGTKLVVGGAQVLLSEEFRSQIQQEG